MAVAEAPAQRTLDGYAYPITDKRGTYLVVHPPLGEGRPTEYDVVERELRKLAIEGLDYERVKRAVAECSGKPVWVLSGVDPDEQAKAEAAVAEAAAPTVDKSQFVFLTIPEDAASAKLTLVPPEDKRIELTMDDVNKVIADAGIVFGFDEEKLAEAADYIERIKSGEWTDPVELAIAHGIEPQHGKDAEYELFFQAAGEGEAKSKPEQTEDGRVDYFAVQEIENTKRGQAVARRLPPTKGVPGKSVRGEEIPARDGQEGTVAIGRGVEHALGNENILVAAVDGQVKYIDNKLEVLALYDVPGDVDLSTGSIDFVGSVIVRGNVQPGFKIIAGEDVTVEGVVDDAEIHAGGTVTVKGGVLGQGGKAKIVAVGNVTAKYIRNATIETKGQLVAQEGLMQCKVSAYSVKLTGKRGVIVGGEIVAETDIVANTIGSNAAAGQTLLTVGDNPARRAELNDLQAKLQTARENQDKTNKILAVLKQMQEKLGTLPPDKKDIQMKAVRETVKLKTEIKPLEEKIAQMTAEDEETRKHHPAKISVVGTMYPGVKVTIRNAKRTIVEEMRYCTLTEKGSEVKVSSFK